MRHTLFVVMILLFSCARQPARKLASTSDCQENGDGCPFLVIGHRGAPYQFAENTIPAFAEALRQGANALELDLVMTKDGEVAVFHDRTPGDFIALLRQMGFEGQRYITYNPGIGSAHRLPAEELTLAEFREYYGYALSRGLLGDIFTNNSKDEHAVIPTVGEFANWANQQAELQAIFLDIKLVPGQEELLDRMADTFAKVFADSKYRVYMMTPYDETYIRLQQWIDRHPDAANRFLMLDMEKANVLTRMRNLKQQLKHRVKALGMGNTPFRSWDDYQLEIESILKSRRQHQANGTYPIVSWTIDDEKKLYRLLQMGVDGILTNRPDRLHRLLKRHWKDHARIAKMLAACEQQGTDVLCSDGSSLDPLGAISYEQLRDWVCDEPLTHDSLKDLYGCGGVFDKKNIEFKGEITSDQQLLLAKDARGKVVVAQGIGVQDGKAYALDFQQEKCFDGALNNSCEYQVQVEAYYQQGWHKLGEQRQQNSFYQPIRLPAEVARIRVILSEMDDENVSEQVVLYFQPSKEVTKHFQSKERGFQGRLALKEMLDAREEGSKTDIQLAFSQAKCADGALNFSCEYKVHLKMFSRAGELLGEKFALNLSDSFELFLAREPHLATIQVTLSEMDGDDVSTSLTFVLDVKHGERIELHDELDVFRGEAKLLLLNYDAENEHAEGGVPSNIHRQNRMNKIDWLQVVP